MCWVTFNFPEIGAGCVYEISAVLSAGGCFSTPSFHPEMKMGSGLLLASGPGSVKETLHRQGSCIDVQVLLFYYETTVCMWVCWCMCVLSSQLGIKGDDPCLSAHIFGVKSAHPCTLRGAGVKLSNLFFHVTLASLFSGLKHISHTDTHALFPSVVAHTPAVLASLWSLVSCSDVIWSCSHTGLCS